MSPESKRWRVRPLISPKADQELRNYSPIMRQLLFNRGHQTQETARQYLEAQLPTEIKTKKLLGIEQAVNRIFWGLNNNESIVIYGDYDADGVTATALLTQVLRKFGADVCGYIPNRFDEGYGLNIEALDQLHTAGTGLVITVDCGVRSLDEINYARKIGLELIITDHHQPGPELPEVCAIINPKQEEDTYPDQNLAGVGLAYKLASALAEKISKKNTLYPDPLASECLDLVALGTITDLAPLIGENRALVRTGLEYIRHPQRPGLMSLIGISQLNPHQITAEHISFVLGPRLNAAGRLDSALAALNLLLTNDTMEAARLAQLLDNQNRERQHITREIQVHAEKLAHANDPDALILFAIDEDYNPGVIGLAAARLQEKFYRPAIVAHQGEEVTRGSCRSIPEFHITQALDKCSELLVRHGGHSAAAGFTVANEKLPTLISRLREIADQELTKFTDLRPTLEADMIVLLSSLKPELLSDLEHLEPVGQSNPPALFVSREIRVTRSRTVGREAAHLKLSVTDGSITYDAIAFRQGYWQSQMPSKIDILYNFELNEYNGRKELQLNIRDLKPSGVPD